MRYTDGENAGKQDEKEKDKGHDGVETSKSEREVTGERCERQ